MPSKLTTRIAGWETAAPRGGRTGGQTSRRGGRTRDRSGDLGKDGIDGQGGQVGGQRIKVNNGVNGVPDFSTIIEKQLQSLLPTILAQVDNQGSNLGNGRIKTAMLSMTTSVAMLEMSLRTTTVEMKSVQDISGRRDNQKVKYTAGSFVAMALTLWNSQIHT
nr:hypothetical protein [Tanacetum cinerariifolium]